MKEKEPWNSVSGVTVHILFSFFLARSAMTTQCVPRSGERSSVMACQKKRKKECLRLYRLTLDGSPQAQGTYSGLAQPQSGQSYELRLMGQVLTQKLLFSFFHCPPHQSLFFYIFIRDCADREKEK
jgi:hypothetical protein